MESWTPGSRHAWGTLPILGRWLVAALVCLRTSRAGDGLIIPPIDVVGSSGPPDRPGGSKDRVSPTFASEPDGFPKARMWCAGPALAELAANDRPAVVGPSDWLGICQKFANASHHRAAGPSVKFDSCRRLHWDIGGRTLQALAETPSAHQRPEAEPRPKSPGLALGFPIAVLDTAILSHHIPQ